MSLNSHETESLKHFSHSPDEALTRLKVATVILGVSMSTLWKLIKTGKLKAVRITERTTAIRAGDLRAFLGGKVES